jgi:hypothetical protein
VLYSNHRFSPYKYSCSFPRRFLTSLGLLRHTRGLPYYVLGFCVRSRNI